MVDWGSVAGKALPVMGNALDGLTIVIGLIVVGAFVFWLQFMLQFKHRFRIKRVTNSGKIVTDDRFRELKGEDETDWWQLMKKKEKVQKAPSEAIEIDDKGRMVVTAYLLSSGEYVYAKDDTQPVPDAIAAISDPEERDEALKEWIQENNTKNPIAAFQPLNSSQRVLMVNQIKKAYAKKKQNWKEMILPIAAISALVILVVSLMIFWGDLAKPALAMHDKQIAMEEMRLEELRIIKEMRTDIQMIKGRYEEEQEKPPD